MPRFDWIGTKAVVATAVCLGLLCSCATAPSWYADDSIRPELPAKVSFDNGAGRGDLLYVTLRLESGEELLFAVDTGSPITILDRSLKPNLGKLLVTKKVEYGWLGKAKVDIYKAPKLYLGNTQLRTDDQVWVDDLNRMASGRAMMGILGMDCLQHYCLQLDFAKQELRFLDPDHSGGENLGKGFPLFLSSAGVTIRETLGGNGAGSGIDTAEYWDGALKSELFQTEEQEEKDCTTMEVTDADGTLRHEARFPKGVFCGETYYDLILMDCPAGENFIGLRFLARHLVTLNFPKRMMYLKRISAGPLADKDNSTRPFLPTFVTEAENFLSTCREKGQLPGWAKVVPGRASFETVEGDPEAFPVSLTFDAKKDGDAAVYHYTVVRASKDSSWKLNKAWQTDASGRTIEEYPVP
jgi:hypothetical protein